MNSNKQLISVLFTAFLLTSCNSVPKVTISWDDNQTEEQAEESTANEEPPSTSSQEIKETTEEFKAEEKSEQKVATKTESEELLDDDGNLVGIHGIYRVDDPKIRKGSSYAIPINTYKELVAEESRSTDTVASQPISIATKEDTKPADNPITVPKKQADNTIAHQEDATDENSGIQEGQFVNNGFDNQLKVELLKVKRIKNAESEQAGNTVVVKLRVKRLVENCDSSNTPTCHIYFYNSKARNVDTYEEYNVISDKYTSGTNFNQLTLNAWAEAYFWLDVPKGVEVIDIIFPYTEIFKNVPIEG